MDIKELKRVLRYDMKTGLWTNRVHRGGTAFAGKTTGRLNSDGYVQICYKCKRYMSSRLAYFYMTGRWPPFEMDHRDLNRKNNKWNNIRPATDSQNQMNKAPSKNGCKGLVKRGAKWGAFITRDRCRKWLGIFDTKHAAVDARQREELKLFGSFARLSKMKARSCDA